MGTASDLFYGLSAALGYGVGDFYARQASHRVGHAAVLFYMSATSLAILAPVAWAFEGATWRPSAAWAWVAVLGLLNAFASLQLYRAFEYGVLSVVSPLSSSYPAITVVLAVAFLGERPSPLALAGIVLALGGVVLLGRAAPHPGTPPPRDARKGLVSAILAFLGYGVFFFGLKYVVADVGAITTAMIARVVTVVLLSAMAVPGLAPLGRPDRGTWPALLVVGVLDVTSFVAFNLGIATGSVAVVGTLSGLFSAVTVAIAAVVLHERLTRPQLAGVLGIFGGVVLLALG